MGGHRKLPKPLEVVTITWSSASTSIDPRTVTVITVGNNLRSS